jgi:phosphosulfolactate synthase
MNYQINDLPERAVKPRNSGITMVMDKGLSLRQAEDFVEVAGAYTDMIKLGWVTSYVTPNLEEKLNIYREAGIPVYFGGTLFEALLVRGQFDEYCRILDKYKMEYAEVSDGSITIEHEEKCGYIQKLSKQVTVISEVGSKDVHKIFAPYKWINLMKAEIEAGSWKVIAEARESGNVGIYRDSGEVRQGLVDEILTQIPAETIIWEVSRKIQM